MSDQIPNSNIFREEVDRLIDDQVVNWNMARENHERLKDVKIKSIKFGSSTETRVQFNPARTRSSSAKVDVRSISERKCFLCTENLPPGQKGVPFGNDYLILVNPFPIFSRHLTISRKSHIDQRIDGRLKEMMYIARAVPDFVLFYNGPRCGASAPDHFHFQAGNKGFLPIGEEIWSHPGKSLLLEHEGIRVHSMENYLRKTLILEGSDPDLIERWFSKAYHFLTSVQKEEAEPMLNILCSWEQDYWRVIVFPRRKHRPWQFFADDPGKILLSPASVDFGGVLITPREEDFHKLDDSLVADVFDQLTLSDKDWENLKKVILT